jgi:RHS repeat-associated protein
VTYEYGGDGKRRKRQDSSATRQYKWDAGWNVISEENGCGTLTMTYVHAPGKVIGTILADVDSDDPSTGTYRYYFQDNIGSTRRLRNDAKASLGSYEYTPYGQVYLQSGATIRHKYTGKEWDDDAKLYYFRYRYYSPSVGRWMTRDPLGTVDGPSPDAHSETSAGGYADPHYSSFIGGWLAGDPLGIVDGPNLYAYCKGNPGNYSDPPGLGLIAGCKCLYYKWKMIDVAMACREGQNRLGIERFRKKYQCGDDVTWTECAARCPRSKAPGLWQKMKRACGGAAVAPPSGAK